MATREQTGPDSIHVPRWVQPAVLPALLVIGWFVPGAIGQMIFVLLFAGLIALVLTSSCAGSRVDTYHGTCT